MGRCSVRVLVGIGIRLRPEGYAVTSRDRDRKTASPSWSPGDLRHSSCSPLVLLPSGPDTVRRTTMHRARAPCRARESWLAERAGFEPAVELPPHTLSKRAPSASRTPLRTNASFKETGGEEGIRTLGPRERSTVFETAPIDHSGTSPQPGLAFYDGCRCLAKKVLRSSRLRAASSPPRWAIGGPRRGSSVRSRTEPQAPNRSSPAPQMTRSMRASRHAVAHIGQGSRVT